MLDFNTLESLYDHVENSMLTEDEIIDLFTKFRDAKQEENNVDAAGKAQWEIDFLSFVGLSYQNGATYTYPTLTSFDEQVYEYLRGRLEVTMQPKFKARYAQILWCSPNKHQQFAKIAIDSYLELIAVYERSAVANVNRRHLISLEIAECVKNMYALSYQSEYKTEEVKLKLKCFIHEFSVEAAFASRNLIDFMLNFKKGFAKDDFEGLENICWKVSESFIDCRDDTAISFLRLGEKVDKQLEKRSHNWVLRIAQHYEFQMKPFERSDQGAEVALSFCMRAIENYKKAGDEKKVQELEKRYAELKKSIEPNSIKMEFDLTEFLKETQSYAREFVKKATSEEIIRVLISDKTLLPTLQGVEASVRESIKQSPTRHLLPKVIFDRNGNPVQNFGPFDEAKDHSLLETYKWQLEMNKRPLIDSILLEAISEKKLASRSLLSELNKLCWYGKLPNCLNIIAPALINYFDQINFYLACPERNKPCFILCLDSLTLKIEMLFRELCRVSGIPTTRHKQDRTGGHIALEKDIDTLLREEAIQKLFDEDDLLFFKFLLVEQCGYNLRHDIAHALLPFQEYTFSYMNLMILALLRLGKYDFAQQSHVDENLTPDSEKVWLPSKA